MAAVNSTASGFTSVLASAGYGNVNIPPQLDQVVDIISNVGPFTVILTLFLMCVVYDQSMFPASNESNDLGC